MLDRAGSITVRSAFHVVLLMETPWSPPHPVSKHCVTDEERGSEKSVLVVGQDPPPDTKSPPMHLPGEFACCWMELLRKRTRGSKALGVTGTDVG